MNLSKDREDASSFIGSDSESSVSMIATELTFSADSVVSSIEDKTNLRPSDEKVENRRSRQPNAKLNSLVGCLTGSNS